MIVLRFSIQRGNLIEDLNKMCHVFIFLSMQRKTLLCVIMLSVNCIHFSQLVNDYVT